MKKLFYEVLAALLRSERVVLAAVIESRGSTPRKVGSVMAVLSDGTSTGTIGGGAIEFEVCRAARELHSGTARSETRGYSLADGGDLRMICGGDVTVHLTALEPDEYNTMVFERALCEPPEGGAWLVLRIKNGTVTVVSLEFRQEHFRATVTPEQLFSHPDFAKENDDFDGLLTVPFTADGTVFIFGGGHVGRALVPVLTGVGFACVVYDDREEYARAEDFPGAVGVVCGDFAQAAQRLAFSAADYAVVVTRSHECDYVATAQALASPMHYVGTMGSRRKVAIIRQRLADEAGLSEAAIARLTAPIGLQIGAETPEELAVSIAAELIKARAARNGAN